MQSKKPLPDLSAINEYVYRVREYGDKRAFEVIFRTYYQRLHGFAKTFVNCSDTSEDIIQTVFLNIWINRTAWNPEGEVKTYLFKAVKNECLNVLRHKKVIEHARPLILQEQEESGESDAVDITSTGELVSIIEEETMKLPQACRRIFQLSRDHGLTYREIAEYLNISINTVNTQMGRALKKIRANISSKINMLVLVISMFWPV